MVTAVYPGTFDPITGGHEDIVRRSASMFDRVVVGVALSRGKSPLFEPEERLAIAREILEPLGNVEVVTFSGLMINFARQHGATVVVRGLRSVTDFDYEFQLAGMNRHMMPELETMFLIPGERYQFVSATLVREIAIMGGEVGQFVSPKVEARLREKVASLKR